MNFFKKIVNSIIWIILISFSLSLGFVIFSHFDYFFGTYNYGSKAMVIKKENYLSSFNAGANYIYFIKVKNDSINRKIEVSRWLYNDIEKGDSLNMYYVKGKFTGRKFYLIKNDPQRNKI